MARPLSGKSAPKNRRTSLIERFGGKVEDAKPVEKKAVVNRPVEKKAAVSKPKAASKPITASKPIQTVDQIRASKRLDTPAAIAKRNAAIKAAKLNKNAK